VQQDAQGADWKDLSLKQLLPLTFVAGTAQNVAQWAAEGGALRGKLAWFHDEFITTEPITVTLHSDADYIYVTDAASAAPATRRRRTKQT
jgi:hypothetical protein